MLDADQLVVLRSVIGSTEPPTDADLHDMYDRLGGVVEVAREVLSKRLADLLNPNVPDSFTIPGQYAQTTGRAALIDALQKQLASLGGGSLSGGVVVLERDDLDGR